MGLPSLVVRAEGLEPTQSSSYRAALRLVAVIPPALHRTTAGRHYLLPLARWDRALRMDEQVVLYRA